MFKKLIVVVALLAIIQNWSDLKAFFNPSANAQIAYSGEVVLYATDWCGYCAKTRSLLRSNDIAYKEFDIEKSEVGYRRYKALGGRGVPLLEINGDVVRGYNPTRIMALVENGGRE